MSKNRRKFIQIKLFLSVKLLIFSFSFFLLAACSNKKCKDAADSARTKPKDQSLMYIWRFTDNLIRDRGNNEKDSGFVSFKPNGEFTTVTNSAMINLNSYNIWYSDKSIIMEEYCLDQVPRDQIIYKYKIKNDTLYLYGSLNQQNDFAIIPKTYLHYKKY
jgi:hypothetical protein